MPLSPTERQSIVEDVLRSLNPAFNPQPRDPTEGLVQEVLSALRPQPKLRVVKDESPLGIQVRCEREVITIIVTPNGGGTYRVKGVRSFNAPGEVMIKRVCPAVDWAVNAGEFDSASYALGHAPEKHVDAEGKDLTEHGMYYVAPWGDISHDHPLTMSFEPMGAPAVLPYLQWTLYGIHTAEIEDELSAFGVPLDELEGLARRSLEQRVRDIIERVLETRPAAALPEIDTEAIAKKREIAPVAAPPETTLPALPEPKEPWGIPRRKALATMMRRRNAR